MAGAKGVPADQVSEGTLLTVGLMAALYGPDRPRLVLIDDLDRGLHPKAQEQLVQLLRGVLAAVPDLQVAATTHSPYLLNSVQPDEVRVTALENGSTVCAPLSQHPKFPTWRAEMWSGEMWSVFGEKWLAERGAAG